MVQKTPTFKYIVYLFETQSTENQSFAHRGEGMSEASFGGVSNTQRWKYYKAFNFLKF